MAAQTLSVLALSTTTSAHHSCNTKPTQSCSLSLPRSVRPDSLASSLLGHKLSVRRSLNSLPVVHKRQCSTVKVLLHLPTAKSDVASLEKVPKWSARAIKAFAMGEVEAKKLKYPQTGTESLLLGILVEGTSPTAKLLRANGFTVYKVRDELVKLLGKSDMYFHSPICPPLTKPAQRALDWAVDEKMRAGDSGEITTAHLLLGIWNEKDYAGHKIMAALGFDDEKAKEVAKFAYSHSGRSATKILLFAQGKVVIELDK